MHRATKLTNKEISHVSPKVGIDWDRLAGLMDIPYAEREEIRVNYGKYPSCSSKAKRVFELFNDDKRFDRHILGEHFEELQRHDLKNEMIPVEDEVFHALEIYFPFDSHFTRAVNLFCCLIMVT